MDDGWPVERNQDAWHLVFLGKLMQRKGNDLFLTVTVEKDLLAETGIPKSSNDTRQLARKISSGTTTVPGIPRWL